MRHGFWFNVRLMNCEIFIFTSSLNFWDPFSFFDIVGVGWIKPSLLDCYLPSIKGQLFKRSLNKIYLSYSKLQRRVICEPYFVTCVTIFIFL